MKTLLNLIFIEKSTIMGCGCKNKLHHPVGHHSFHQQSIRGRNRCFDFKRCVERSAEKPVLFRHNGGILRHRAACRGLSGKDRQRLFQSER